MPPSDLISRIERTALILGGLATLASLVSLDPGVVAGVFIGAAIGWLNLAAVRLLFERGAQMPDRRGTVMTAFLVKSVLLLALVGVVVFTTGIDGMAFLGGFSAAVLAVLAVPVLSLWAPAKGDSGQTGGDA